MSLFYTTSELYTILRTVSRFVRLGVNNSPQYRLLLDILYYTGIRTGEVLAMTYNDFEQFNFYKFKVTHFESHISSSSGTVSAVVAAALLLYLLVTLIPG